MIRWVYGTANKGYRFVPAILLFLAAGYEAIVLSRLLQMLILAGCCAFAVMVAWQMPKATREYRTGHSKSVVERYYAEHPIEVRER